MTTPWKLKHVHALTAGPVTEALLEGLSVTRYQSSIASCVYAEWKEARQAGADVMETAAGHMLVVQA